MKYFLDPPKRHKDTNGRDMATLIMYLIIAACDLDFTRSISCDWAL